jgi:hypothetical protein
MYVVDIDRLDMAAGLFGAEVYSCRPEVLGCCVRFIKVPCEQLPFDPVTPFVGEEVGQLRGEIGHISGAELSLGIHEDPYFSCP